MKRLITALLISIFPALIQGQMLQAIVGSQTVAAGCAAVSSDGFEAGVSNLAAGDGSYWAAGGQGGNGALAETSASPVFSGTYSAKTSWTSNGSQYAYAKHAVSANAVTDCNFEFQVVSMTAGTQIQLRACANNGVSTLQLLYVIPSSTSAYKLNVITTDNTGSTTLTGTHTLSTGVWYNIEMQYVSNATTGGGQYWINGVSEGSNFTQATNNVVPDSVAVGLNYAGNVTAGTVAFDAFQYANCYI